MQGDRFVSVDLEGGDASPVSPKSLRLKAALADVSECRANLAALREPPDHEAVEQARDAISAIDAALSSQLERLVFLPSSQTQLSQTEEQLREAARVAKAPHEAILAAEELYRSYAQSLKDAEHDMIRLSSPDDAISEEQVEENEEAETKELVHMEISRAIAATERGEQIDEVQLNGRGIVSIPNSLFSLASLVVLDLSCNKLEVLSDSIGNLVNIASLSIEKNRLKFLPDSIGLLKNLKHLNVSENKLTVLPDSIVMCRRLICLRATLNELSYLPTQIGSHLLELEELAVQWNKLRILPSSICNLKSLKYLYVMFNQLKELPAALGNLSNLEVLDASCNFMDLKTLPDTIGCLTSMVELNLRCNQIHALPDSFGNLQNLKKLDLKENPLVIPPPEVVKEGVEAVLTFMMEWQRNRLEEEKRKLAEELQPHNKWLSWTTSAGAWLTSMFSGSSDQGTASIFQRSKKDDFLEQQL